MTFSSGRENDFVEATRRLIAEPGSYRHRSDRDQQND